MSATVLPFRRSTKPCLPRIDITAYHGGEGGSVVYDVELFRHDGQNGFDVLATFGDPDEAEAFAERWMAEHADLGGAA
ncbi:hypothetical protein [Hansschlegelia beijingensis]|uniref:Uncharacterized protein n=1 Tax=Hansschlegelia beijingensis TaxID=1133344 RepID=A0A7W6CWP7_9HYPH|nr:hypothetical protein [Hansschlegelia beijingensis]MBB3972520.1 hypothetical protein [Hansschlegelia beijingensis]